LAGTTATGILSAFEDFKNGRSKKGRIPKLWDGKAAERIVDILLGQSLPLRVEVPHSPNKPNKQKKPKKLYPSD